MSDWLPGVDTRPLPFEGAANTLVSAAADDGGDWLAAEAAEAAIPAAEASYLASYLHVNPFLVQRLQTGRVREQRLFVRRHSSQDPTLRFSTPDAR